MDLKSALPFCRVGELERRHDTSWLIESLWLNQAAGIIGGQPKCCKSWLGIDMAVSVASGTPCLGHFSVKSPGPTLVYLAEDALPEVRLRVEGICRSRKISIDTLDLTVITAPVLRLDVERDQERLWNAVDTVKPRLLLLDPLVRLHRLDENNSRDIAGILGFLREIQRKFAVAVVLAHHSSKRASSRPGQGLRGSSDLHAFGDSNLYLTRDSDQLKLTVEHRSAAAIDPTYLELLTGDDVHLAIAGAAPMKSAPPAATIEERILNHLTDRGQPVNRNSLRNDLKVNNQRFGLALTTLLANGRVTASSDGISLT